MVAGVQGQARAGPAGRRTPRLCLPVGGSIMSDIVKSESKPPRPPSRPKGRPKNGDVQTADEADDFGAGIVEAAPAAPVAEEPTAAAEDGAIPSAESQRGPAPPSDGPARAPA